MATQEVPGQLALFGSHYVGPEGVPKEEAQAHWETHAERFRQDQLERMRAHNAVKNQKHMIEQEPAPDAVQVRAQMLGVHNRITGVFHDRRGRVIT